MQLITIHVGWNWTSIQNVKKMQWFINRISNGKCEMGWYGDTTEFPIYCDTLESAEIVKQGLLELNKLYQHASDAHCEIDTGNGKRVDWVAKDL
jgi:hypothetical protein